MAMRTGLNWLVLDENTWPPNSHYCKIGNFTNTTVEVYRRL